MPLRVTFPPALVEKCLKAGTSEKGVCPHCGAPWVRVVEKSGGTTGKSWHNHSADKSIGMSQYDPLKQKGGVGKAKDENGIAYSIKTLGFRSSCKCPAHKPIPATVLDPFLGSGTTCLVAAKMGRDSIGIELKPDYCAMAEKRLKDTMGMLVEICP